MKNTQMFLLLIFVFLIVAGLSGCENSNPQEEGGSEMEAQKFEMGTPLDERPEVTETAIFGLG